MEMQIISKVSKGSKMDQVYLPKNRQGFAPGSYVVLKLVSSEQTGLETEKIAERHNFFGVKNLEPIKIEIINNVFSLIYSQIRNVENAIITGSFLEKGFNFNDIDIIVITEEKINEMQIKEKIEENIGIKTHIIQLSQKSLLEGISTDPLYENMLSRCVSKKRIVFNIKRKINSQILDLHLLKSKSLIDNFDILTGKEKYYLTKNLAAIALFVEGKKISNEPIDRKISNVLGVEVNDIKENMLEKKNFLKKYEDFYEKTFKILLNKAERK